MIIFGNLSYNTCCCATFPVKFGPIVEYILVVICSLHVFIDSQDRLCPSISYNKFITAKFGNNTLFLKYLF